METNDDITEEAAEMRRGAEKIVRKKSSWWPKKTDSLSPEEMKEALHELQVHQVELEMQNEELRRMHAELDAEKMRYFDLYNMAPVGYCTISDTDVIMEANLTLANKLGVDRWDMIRQSIYKFIFKEDKDVYYKYHRYIFDTILPRVCELRMQRGDGSVFWAQMEASVTQDTKTGTICRVAISDISARRGDAN